MDFRPQEARSVAGKNLPPLPENLSPDASTLLLFYQYIEPMWTKKEHKLARVYVLGLALQLGLTGRGRCARQGLNCTFTGLPEGVRAFCEGLRAYHPLFLLTDFKLTDGVEGKPFKGLSIRKTDELVAYGLAGDAAPSLASSAGVRPHLLT